MADVTKTIHVKVQTFDPVGNQLIPLSGVTILIEDNGWLYDPNLSSGDDTTDNQGLAQVQVTYDDEDDLNPFLTITIPDAARTVPAAAAANQQFQLPGRWVTRHYVKHRITDIAAYEDPANPLTVFVGLHARMKVSYSDFDASQVRNPLALPEDTIRVHLADYDEFLWIDCLNPDDTLEGFGVNQKDNQVISIGDEDEYPYFNVWPTATLALDDPPAADATPRAWIDPPGFPVGNLGGGSFQKAGPLATDCHGFVFMIDGEVVHRFYPDGTLDQTISGWTTFGGPDRFNHPGGLALDQYRNLYVADTGNHRIVIFQPDYTDGLSGQYTFVRSFGSQGAAVNQFNRPQGLAVVGNRVADGPEMLAVTDSENHRIQVFRINIAVGGAIRTGNTLRPNLVFQTQFGAPAGGSAAAVANPVAGEMWEPVGVASDRQSNLYVCDRAWHRVSVWNPDRVNVPTHYAPGAEWEKAGGMNGNGPGEFDTPEAIAVDTKNQYVYVAESGNQRVQRLDAGTGAHQVDWQHTYSPVLGSAFLPTSVSVDTRGEVYAADTANQRVVRATTFDVNGAPLGDGVAPNAVGDPWTPRTEAGHMLQPAYVTYSADGKLWASDSGNNRVLVFQDSPSGELTQAPNPITGGLNNPVGVAFDQIGSVFVVDSGNNRVRTYDPSLTHLTDTGGAWSKRPRGIAVDSSGNVYVVKHTESRVQKLNSSGDLIFSFGRPGIGDGEFDGPSGVAVDSSDNVYVVDTSNHRVQKFDSTGAFQLQWGAKGTGDGEFENPTGIAIDSSDNIFVVDTNNHRVQEFDSAATFQAKWGANGNGDGEFDSPTGIAIDSSDNIYVVDTGNHRVQKFDSSAAFQAKWGANGNGDGEFDSPTGIAIDSSDNIYVVDTGNHRVQKFDSAAAFQAKWGTNGTGDGEFDSPWGTAINSGGTVVYIADHNNNRIQLFDAAGAFQSKWGEGGSGDQEFDNPRGVAFVIRNGAFVLYVADRDNNRVKVMKQDGTITHITNPGGTALDHPEDVAIDADGKVYIADTGNARIVQLDDSDAHLQDITVTQHGLILVRPTGVSVDDQGNLVVTDFDQPNNQSRVFHIETSGNVLAHWDLRALVRQQNHGALINYRPELARLLLLDTASRAAINSQGMLAIADTGHNRVRLVRTYTDLNVNLFDLGERLPDVSFRAVSETDWGDDLGLKVSVGGDDDRNFITDPEDDYSGDEYTHQETLSVRSINAGINAMRVFRLTQRWLAHLTRADDAEHRWGLRPDDEFELEANLKLNPGSFRPWDEDEVYLGGDASGRGLDSWDDGVVSHEMTHWIAEKAFHPRIPFERVGGTHSLDHIRHQSLAFNEGFSEYVQLFWGSEFGSVSNIRGYPLNGFSPLSTVRVVSLNAAGAIVVASTNHLYGGPAASATPNWGSPNQGVGCEGYFANTMWQIHQAVVNTSTLFADSQGYWHAHNALVSQVQSQRFVDIIWKPLRLFPEDPTDDQFQKGCEQYLKQVLGQVNTAHPALAQTVQSIFELNNQLMPVINITEGTSGNAPGTAVADPLDVQEGTTRNFIIQVTDAVGNTLSGYNLRIRVSTGVPAHYSFPAAAPSPAALHGIATPGAPPATDLYRATNASGIVNLDFAPGAGTAGNQETIDITYQPDFDLDDSFKPPEKADDQETTLRRLFLYELRAANKTWTGTGNNLGAIVTKTQRFNIQAP